MNAAAAQALVRRIFANVPVFDGGGRAATTTFAQRKIGDALATFESEVPLILKEFGADYDVVYPSLEHPGREPGVHRRQGRRPARHPRKVAEEYLKYLWSDEGQDPRGASTSLRPRSAAVLARPTRSSSRSLQLFTVDELFGGWTKAQKDHFDDGASLRPDHRDDQALSGREKAPPCSSLARC